AETRLDIARARELRRVIGAIPSLEDASVVWARSKPARWPERKEAKVTATVSLKPRRNREVTRELVESVRLVVSGMVPDLKTEDVTVFDVSTGRAYGAESEMDAASHSVHDRARQLQQDYERHIATALSYIPGVLVTVSVGPPAASPEAAAVEPSVRFNQSVGGAATEEVIAAEPTSVQVSIAIPEDYYHRVAADRGLTAGSDERERAAYHEALRRIEEEETATARATAARLIPAGSPAGAVVVNSVASIGSEPPPRSATPPSTFPKSLPQWISLAGLALLGSVVVWTVYRGAPGRSRAAHPQAECEAAPGDACGLALLLTLDDAAIQTLLEDVDGRHWALALTGASSAIRQRILAALPPSAAALLEEHIASLGPVRLGDIEAAQTQILEALRANGPRASITAPAGVSPARGRAAEFRPAPASDETA
ncbi:MAG: FliG C-terminal domain-containing protein, partial [Planctomycetaceae bacterium]